MKNFQAAEVAILEARKAGLHLTAVGSELRVKPQDRLTDPLRQRLKFYKAEILEVLRHLEREEAKKRVAAEAAGISPTTTAPPIRGELDFAEPDSIERGPQLAASIEPVLGVTTLPADSPPWPRGPQHCMTCWGTRFVYLRDGHRWACFTCAGAKPGEVVAECDNGPKWPERARAWARAAEERASGMHGADEATPSQASCGGEVTANPTRPDGAEESTHENR